MLSYMSLGRMFTVHLVHKLSRLDFRFPGSSQSDVENMHVYYVFMCVSIRFH